MEPIQKQILPDIVQCPYYSKHQIQKSRYFHHLKVCDKRPEAQPCYPFSKHFDEESLLPKYEVNLEVAHNLHDKIKPIISKFQHWLALFEKETNQKVLDMTTPFPESVKHAPQLRSLVAHIIDQIPVSGTVIEAGAGTGMLTAYIAFQNKVVETQANRKFLLIERERGFRHKFDKYAKAQGEQVDRILCDLRGMDFQKFKEHYDNKDVQIIGKHLCGHATDCVLNWSADHYAIALCCHAKADGRKLIGRQYLDILNEQELCTMCRMSSWQFAWIGQDDLSDESKEKIKLGTLFRQVLDCCRMEWLSQNGYWVELEKYCNTEDSPECWLLLAGKK